MTIIAKPWPHDCMPDVMKAIELVKEHRYTEVTIANKDSRTHKPRTYGDNVVVGIGIADYDE